MRFSKFLLTLLALALVILTSAPAVMAQDAQPLVPLDDPMAPFLESRAYAAKMGATAEFRKMEWVALDPNGMKLYLAMSEINKDMSDDKGDIRLKENNCGIVYVADLDAAYDVKNLRPLIVGGPYTKDAKGDRCDVNNISNPDSLFVDPKGNLWIGEDTSNHVNNMIWRWDGKNLARFATLPKGSEATGVMITPANDLFFSIQHPSAMSTYPYNRAVVGVVNGFKADQAFKPVGVPAGDAMHTLTTAAGKFQAIARVGEPIPSDIYGNRWGQINYLAGGQMNMCNQPDGNVFLATNEAATEGYLVTNYECRPGGVGKAYIRQVGDRWEVLEGENISFDGVNGTWNNCGSSRTPWNTVLTSEEYEPPARSDAWIANVQDMSKYMGKQANPYEYGWNVELVPDTNGDSPATLVEKRYAMGRFSHEVVLVMPDGKTAYHGDDGTGMVLFKTVADEAGDLSAGTIYAAKVTQAADDSLGLTWIKLASGSDDEIAEALMDMELPTK
jgi:secreted PhoX family phosphatase